MHLPGMERLGLCMTQHEGQSMACALPSLLLVVKKILPCPPGPHDGVVLHHYQDLLCLLTGPLCLLQVQHEMTYLPLEG